MRRLSAQAKFDCRLKILFWATAILFLVLPALAELLAIKTYLSTNGKSDGFSGNGLLNMNRRAAKFGGSFSIESQIGKGTTAILNVPVGRKTSVEKAQCV